MSLNFLWTSYKYSKCNISKFGKYLTLDYTTRCWKKAIASYVVEEYRKIPHKQYNIHNGATGFLRGMELADVDVEYLKTTEARQVVGYGLIIVDNDEKEEYSHDECDCEEIHTEKHTHS